jgi:hypothetical protein
MFSDVHIGRERLDADCRLAQRFLRHEQLIYFPLLFFLCVSVLLCIVGAATQKQQNKKNREIESKKNNTSLPPPPTKKIGGGGVRGGGECTHTTSIGTIIGRAEKNGVQRWPAYSNPSDAFIYYSLSLFSLWVSACLGVAFSPSHSTLYITSIPREKIKGIKGEREYIRK